VCTGKLNTLIRFIKRGTLKKSGRKKKENSKGFSLYMRAKWAVDIKGKGEGIIVGVQAKISAIVLHFQ